MSSDAPSIDDLLAELRLKLKRLHRLSGEPSTRELARRTGGVITHSTVHAVLRCARLPRWGPLELVVEALGGEQDDFRTRWIAIRDTMDVVAATHSQGMNSSADAGETSQYEETSERSTFPETNTDLRQTVLSVVATMLKTTPDQVKVDSDGDLGIRAGSAMVFVRVRDNPPLVDVFSPILTEVAPSERLYAKLSELTNRMPIGRIYHTHRTIWGSIPVFGRQFQETHLILAIQVMTGIADELDDRLNGEFGGQRFFGDSDPKVETE